MVQILPTQPRRPSTAERFSDALGTGLQGLGQRSQQRQQMQAMQEMGVDPAILSLPQEAQAAYFKNKFSPEKQMTPLQQSQQALNEERLNALKQQQDVYKNLFGGGQQQSPQQGFDQMPEEGGFEPQGQGFDLKSIPKEKLRQGAAFAGQPGEMGVVGNMFKAELERQEKEEGRSFEREKMSRKEESEISKPILLELNQARKNIPLQEQAIEDIENASPDVGALDFIADVTGFEPLRSSSGAKLKTAIKDFFLSDLTRAGARPNMWIEQQLADALPKIGRSKEANLITAAGMRFKVDLAKKRIETIDNLAEQDREKFGYVRGDIDSRASKEMKKFVIDRQKKLKEDIEGIKSKKELSVDIVDRYLEKSDNDFEKAAEMAKKDGYIW